MLGLWRSRGGPQKTHTHCAPSLPLESDHGEIRRSSCCEGVAEPVVASVVLTVGALSWEPSPASQAAGMAVEHSIWRSSCCGAGGGVWPSLLFLPWPCRWKPFLGHLLPQIRLRRWKRHGNKLGSMSDCRAGGAMTSQIWPWSLQWQGSQSNVCDRKRRYAQIMR